MVKKITKINIVYKCPTWKINLGYNVQEEQILTENCNSFVV